jgi:hypothetical protein
MYLEAVPDAFGSDIDFAQLVKVYGNDPEGQKRYSPAHCLGTKRIEVIGEPDRAHVSTSYVERQNLNMRMGMRRFTRLTNTFSKKIENHIAMISLSICTITSPACIRRSVLLRRWKLVSVLMSGQFRRSSPLVTTF